jgi:hypothetical protein
MITYFTLNLPALYPGTKSASKTAANEWKKLTKTIIRGTTILSKFTSTGTIYFL